MNRKGQFLLILVLIISSSCTQIDYRISDGGQTGEASWYGPGFHGRHTSSTEVYNMYDFTAAHRTLAFGTYVMVTNLDNNKSVVVRINDRGPFIKGRIIDLSYAAAKALDMVKTGVAPVKIEIVDGPPDETGVEKTAVQVGAFNNKSNASALKKKLERRYNGVYLSTLATSSSLYYRVRIRAKSVEKAKEIACRLAQEGFTPIIVNEHKE